MNPIDFEVSGSKVKVTDIMLKTVSDQYLGKAMTNGP